MGACEAQASRLVLWGFVRANLEGKVGDEHPQAGGVHCCRLLSFCLVSVACRRSKPTNNSEEDHERRRPMKLAVLSRLREFAVVLHRGRWQMGSLTGVRAPVICEVQCYWPMMWACRVSAPFNHQNHSLTAIKCSPPLPHAIASHDTLNETQSLPKKK